MIYGRIRAPLTESRAPQQTRSLRDRAFLWKLIGGLGIGLLGGTLMFLLPALFFVEQNYEIFVNLAYDVKPSLVQHLEREMIWLRFFLVSSALTTAGVGLFFVRRLVRYLIKPLEQVEDHMRSLGEGRWNQPLPQSPDSETYRSFFASYENFNRALLAQAEAELRLLQKISVDPSDREAFMAWRALVSIQTGKLNHKTEASESGEASSEVLPFRRVS